MLLGWILGMMLGVCQGETSKTGGEKVEWLRYPAISPDGKAVVFGQGADLFLVDRAGGEARLLTGSAELDYLPRWSPDGKMVAFASNRAGNEDVYVVEVATGAVTRLTYFSGTDRPLCFGPDGKDVWFESTRQNSVKSLEIPSRRLAETYRVPVTGGRIERMLPMAAEDLVFSADGTKALFHDRKGYEDQWRKHHVSSVTRDVWLWGRENDKYQKVTDFGGEDRNPVWDGDGAFLYLSEKSGSFNVWRKELGGDTTQVTFLKDHPVRFLSRAGDGTLCFGWHGGIYLLSGEEKAEPKRLDVKIRKDRTKRPQVVSYDGDIKEMTPSKDGKEVAWISRGEVFVTAVDHAETKRITETPGQERSVDFHPEGRSLVYASEREGSWNLYTATIGRESEKSFHTATIVNESPLLEIDAETFQPKYSPDGKRVAFLRDRVELCVIEVESRKVTSLLDGRRIYSYKDGDIDFEWSPDGEFLATYQFQEDRWVENIVLVRSDGTGKAVDVSKNGYYDMAPRWTLDGEGLAWVSNRHGRKAHGSWGYDLDVYLGFLTERARRVFQLSKPERQDFEEREKEAKKKEKSEDKEKKDDESAEAKEESKDDWRVVFNEERALDLAGVPDRTVRLTEQSTELEDYAITPDGKVLFYVSSDLEGLQLWKRNLVEKKTSRVTSFPAGGGRDAVELVLADQGKKLFGLVGGRIYQVGVGDGKKERVDGGGKMRLDLAAEREEMFEHVWRQVREKFHRKDLHGVDWDFYKKEYQQLLPAVETSYEFANLVGEMLGELDASHTGCFFRPRISGGESTASLGIFYDLNFEGAGIRIAEVIEGGPLDGLEVTIPSGAVIKSLNGKELAAGENFFPMMEGLSGKRTLLGIEVPGKEELIEVVVRPISLEREAELRYRRWSRRMRAQAEELSDGQIGWAHVRGMNDGAFRAFFSEVFGHHADKKAMVVDTRFNGGGWLTEDLTTFLSGKQFLKFYPRGQGNMGGEPIFRWTKPSAVVMSEGNYSDAHLFPYAYQALKIGPLVGMPVPGTGTAVWWERLQDSRLVFGIPQVSTIDTEGRYLENTQLEPDVKVNYPFEAREEGEDPQLKAAVKYLMELPEEEKWPLPGE